MAGALPFSGNAGAIEVATSKDGKFVFSSLENENKVQVSNLARALSAGFRASGVEVGTIPTSLSPVGEAVSPDGRWLYVTSIDLIASANSPARQKGCPGDQDAAPGDVRTFSIATAERDPADARPRTALAGSTPVRVVLSGDGGQAWVAAQGSNALLGLATAKLQAGKQALDADVRTGSDPTGLILVDGGRWAVVADSNRCLEQLHPTAAGCGQHVSRPGRRARAGGEDPAGVWPRELGLSPDGRTLYVTNYASDQLETISVPALVSAAGEGRGPSRSQRLPGDVAEHHDLAVALGARLAFELHAVLGHPRIRRVEVVDPQEEPDPAGVLVPDPGLLRPRRRPGPAAGRWRRRAGGPRPSAWAGRPTVVLSGESSASSKPSPLTKKSMARS